MSTFSIPNSAGQIRQDNRSDTFGELNETFNIDLNAKYGKIKSSKKLVKVLDEVAKLEDEDVVAFEIYENKFYLVTTGDIWRCTVTDDPTVASNWIKETGIAIAEGPESDATVFGGLLLISTGTNIASWNSSADNANWWTGTVSGSTLTDNYPHMLHLHRGGQETLFVTDKNLVRYYNATAGHSTVTLQTDLVASCIDSGVDAIWVGTYTESGSHAYVYRIYIGETDEFGTTIANKAYKVEGRAVLSLRVVDNVPYVITEKGNLQAFNGSGFSTVASFPFTATNEVLSGVRAGLVQDSGIARPVHPNGMQSHNESIYLNINTNVTTGDFAERSPSGIWEYNTRTQVLHHRFAFCNASTDAGMMQFDQSGPLFIVDGEETLLFAGATQLDGNNGVYMESATAPTSYFVTTEITSGTIAEAHEAVYIKAKTLASGESIALKYRIKQYDKQFADVSFLDGKSFTTTDDLTAIMARHADYTERDSGEEVTISETGKMAHIVSITKGTSTYTVVLDEEVATAGDNVRAGFENWLKDPETYTEENGEWKSWGGYGTNPWVEYKVVMQGDIEIRQFLNKGNSKIEV